MKNDHILERIIQRSKLSMLSINMQKVCKATIVSRPFIRSMILRMFFGGIVVAAFIVALFAYQPAKAAPPEEPLDPKKPITSQTRPLIELSHISIDGAVAGMAVASTGHAYAWYRDGTVTAGSYYSLDDHRSPYYYRTPPGKSPSNIVAMAISASDKVYTWYDDGTRSVGNSRDLDSYKPPEPYKLPFKTRFKRYTPSEIVGIAITAKDEVVTYFSDGTFARGNSLNLGAISSKTNYSTAVHKKPQAILGVGYHKLYKKFIIWSRDGYVTMCATQNLQLCLSTRPFTQHLTIYSFKKNGLKMSEPNAPIFELPGPVVRVRGDLDFHEPILAPGYANIAVAHSWISIFRKTGEMIMHVSGNNLFRDFIIGSSDPVRNLNTYAGLGDCEHNYPQTHGGHGFCVKEVYDTRAAYDKIGKRFIFLANARNFVWQGDRIIHHEENPEHKCAMYKAPGGSKGINVFSSAYCNHARRYLLIAVSKSENPEDGFHLYAIKENNYRDWPLLTVNGDQLIVGHKNIENPDGYVAIVFDLAQMRQGSKRPRYFKLYKKDFAGVTAVNFPRIQEGSVLTVGIGGGYVFGFSKSHQGYTMPKILKTKANLISSANWTLSHGALRLAKGNSNRIYYGKYPIATSLAGIDVKTTPAEGATPYGPLSIPDSDMVSFDCPRLTVTNAGDEVIAFAGVRRRQGSKVSYDGAFIVRKSGHASFGAPVSYSKGTYPDPVSNADAKPLCYNKGNCQQQSGAERDPFERRVWMMQGYGLEQIGNCLKLRGALGWVRIE